MRILSRRPTEDLAPTVAELRSRVAGYQKEIDELQEVADRRREALERIAEERDKALDQVREFQKQLIDLEQRLAAQREATRARDDSLALAREVICSEADKYGCKRTSG